METFSLALGLRLKRPQLFEPLKDLLRVLLFPGVLPDFEPSSLDGGVRKLSPILKLGRSILPA